MPAGMPTNERAIAAAAYAAAHSRSKGCPLLGQIAYRAFMEEAHEHIAHECPTHFHVVMGECDVEGQSEDRGSKTQVPHLVGDCCSSQ